MFCLLFMLHRRFSAFFNNLDVVGFKNRHIANRRHGYSLNRDGPGSGKNPVGTGMRTFLWIGYAGSVEKDAPIVVNPRFPAIASEKLV